MKRLVKPSAYPDGKAEKRYLVHCEQVAFILANSDNQHTSQERIDQYFEITGADVEEMSNDG